MTDEELFYKLEPHGCYHNWRKKSSYFECDKCGFRVACYTQVITNPDFTTWKGFGWLWERTYEREDKNFSWNDFSYFGDDPSVLGYVIHNVRFADKLKEYFEFISIKKSQNFKEKGEKAYKNRKENNMDYIVIRDMSAGNESVGEMWQETKIFTEEATLKEVMDWATDNSTLYSRKRITITKPHDGE